MPTYNPPPNWPTPPPGWSPSAAWVPDPSWGPPPPGWQLWRDDPKPGLRRGSKIALGVVVGLLALCGVGVIGAITGGDEADPAAALVEVPTGSETDDAAATREAEAEAAAQKAAEDAAQRAADEAAVQAEADRVAAAKVVADKAAAEQAAANQAAAEVAAAQAAAEEAARQAAAEDDSAPVYYENCDAVRAAGAAPIRRGDPGYASHLDRDNDGQGCAGD